MHPCAMTRRVLAFVAFALLAAPILADDPSLGATAAGQAVADALRDFTDADVALVPAGVLKDSDRTEDAATSLAFEGDGVVVVGVSGAKLREALERSVSAFPQSSVGFLQVSGLEASFRKSAPANARLTSVTVGGAKLDDDRIYRIAMPVSLQQGQLGYANLWETSTILRRFDKATLGTVARGKRVGVFAARWSSGV